MTSHKQNDIIKQQEEQEVIVVMVPFPAQGHLNQLLQLSRLILSYNIPVHYISSATHNRQAKLRVHCWDLLPSSNIIFHDFEIPSFPCPPPNPNSTCKFPSQLMPCFEASKHLRHPLSTFLHTLSEKARRVVVINDSLMASVIQDVGLIPNAESYTFQSVSAFAIYLYTWESLGNPFEPTSAVIPEGTPSLEDCFTPEFMNSIVSEYEDHKINNSGNVYNTSRVIEGAYMDLLEKTTVAENLKHWALGPFNPLTILPKGDSNSKRHNICLEWLDKQESNSVLYVSFGTTTAMSDEQINELAIGLKESNQKFIWVLRDADKGDVFHGEVRRAELPKGYEESVKDKGLIVRDWAPQLEILAHSATGGFMSHCGWNSCMESITMGVPIAAWPMHSDQPRNTVLVTQVLRVGMVVRDWARRNEIVRCNVIENAVKRLMATKEGDQMRKTAVEMGGNVRRSMDEGGVCRMEFDSFVAHITR